MWGARSSRTPVTNGVRRAPPPGMITAMPLRLLYLILCQVLGLILLLGPRKRTASVRTQLIHTPARLAHSAHQQLLHLPRDWPWEAGLDELFRHALHDP